MNDPDVASVEVLVGRLGRPHGIRGEITVDVRTDEPERRFAPGTTFRTGRGPLTLTAHRWHGDRLLATFVELPDRSAAEEWRGVELRIDVSASERPDDPDEFYDHQLVGLLVVDADGAELGRVREVLHLPGQDVLAVATAKSDAAGGRAGAGEVLLPFVADIVPDVDLVTGTLVARPPIGLFGEEED